MLVKLNGRIVVALNIILFLGCPGQGAPQRGQYMWVRCKPDANSANCIEEKGPSFTVTDGNLDPFLPSKADPVLMKTFQDHPSTFQFPGDEYGSGSEVDPETGSGFEDEIDNPSMLDFVNQPDSNLKLKLTNGGSFLQENIL